jgi:hypothetical protein
LRSGEDWSAYSAKYDGLVAAEFQATAHRKQREAEARRLALIDENYRRLRAEEQSWNPVQPGVTTTCISCGAEVHIYGTYRDGFDDTDPREPHLFKDSTEGRSILTARCDCGKSIAVDIGRVAPAAPRNFTGLDSVKKMAGIKSKEAPVSVGTERKPKLRERLLGV